MADHAAFACCVAQRLCGATISSAVLTFEQVAFRLIGLVGVSRFGNLLITVQSLTFASSQHADASPRRRSPLPDRVEPGSTCRFRLEPTQIQATIGAASLVGGEALIDIQLGRIVRLRRTGAKTL